MSEFFAADHAYMARALQLAERGLYTTTPNPRVGCVIVKDDTVVGEGWHEFAGGPHAEVHALAEAGERARGATAYVTLEPCSHHGRTPPCADALLNAGVSRVVAAMEDPNPLVAGNGLRRLRAAGIAVASGLMQAQAEALNPGFIRRMRDELPYVRCKLAMSLDGRTAMASGESKWITGSEAREDVQRLRARSCAIITGIGTVLADDPNLTVRFPLPGGRERQPLRVVLDPRLSMPESSRLLQQPGGVLVVTACDETTARHRLERAGAEVVYLPQGLDRVDLEGTLRLLAERQVNEVLVETGATLSGAMLQAGLIDELVIYMAPLLMGDAARGLFRLPGMERMEQRIELNITDLRAVGKDWRITAKIEQKANA
jgi:diaminohydroxyphosphoribosylaminopyrimidine deaminase/5-amino-6-(5-phosphoribosylamino)uracil reductase